jgi:hypothetical protein
MLVQILCCLFSSLTAPPLSRLSDLAHTNRDLGRMQLFDRSVLQQGGSSSISYCYLLVAIDHHERAELRERRICKNSLLASTAEFRKVAACGAFAFAPTRLCMHSPKIRSAYKRKRETAALSAKRLISEHRRLDKPWLGGRARDLVSTPPHCRPLRSELFQRCFDFADFNRSHRDC